MSDEEVQSIVDKHMLRITIMGAQNSFVAIPGVNKPILIREALIDYLDDVVDSLEDIRFHFVDDPVENVDLSRNETIYLSVNPYEMGWMKKTVFITDDLATRKTINLKVALRNEKTNIKLNNFFNIIISIVNEIDRIGYD